MGVDYDKTRLLGSRLFRSYERALDYVQKLHAIGGYGCTIYEVTDVVREWHRIARTQRSAVTWRVDIYEEED